MKRCKKCGECCNLFEVVMPMEEEARKAIIHRVEMFLGLEFKDIRRLSIKLYATCKHYNAETKQCRIYKKRPAICRAFTCGRN